MSYQQIMDVYDLTLLGSPLVEVLQRIDVGICINQVLNGSWKTVHLEKEQ